MKSMLKSLMSVAVAALAFTSCSTDATDEVIAKNEPKTLVVNTTIDQTRTTLAGDHVKLNWSANDQIYLYIGESETAAPNVIDINPETGKNTITGVTYVNGNKVYANYSLNNDKSQGVKKAEINIKNKQTQKNANEFAGENLPMVAKGEIIEGAVNLTFQPVGCVLVFNVYGQDNTSEKIKSIKFDPGVTCCGFQYCDLTAETLGYVGNSDYSYNNSITVTVTNSAEIVAAKPDNTQPNGTQLGSGNQVYMVVAPLNYTAATFTVTTEANKTYTFVTKSGIDCSQNTARVVNINLANAAEMQPAIEVPTVNEQPSSLVNELVISPIVFKNFTTEQVNAAHVIGVYSDKDLTQELNPSWITYNATIGEGGVLKCQIAANTNAESRTAYIGIQCGDVKAAIAVTQVGAGSVPAAPDPSVANVDDIVTASDYKLYQNDDWTVTCGGNNKSLGSNANGSKIRTLKDYPKLAEAMGLSTSDYAAAVISRKVLPAGYNTATLKYTRVTVATLVGIAFSADGVNWTKIAGLEELSTSSTSPQTYSFSQQGAGYYAFVAKTTVNNARIDECEITYSQSQE